MTGLIQSLWRLSSVRLLTSESHPDRGYYLFVSVLNDTGEPTPTRTITRLMGEAALHRINVVWGDVSSAAHFIEGLENGRFKHSDFTDWDPVEDEE